MPLPDRLRLYLVADFSARPPARVMEAVAAGLGAGVTAVQYRDKSDVGPEERRRRAESLGRLVSESGALYIVNDDPELAVLVGADGVHLGPTDLPVAIARQRFGETLLIGGSAGTPERARELEADGVDYLGVGAIFEARVTKPNASAPRGPAVLSAVSAAVAVPIVAIGGIDADNAEEAAGAGATGVAVVRAILDADDPAAAARALRRAVARGRERGGRA